MLLKLLFTFSTVFVNFIHEGDGITPAPAKASYLEGENYLTHESGLIDYTEMNKIRRKIIRNFPNDSLCFIGPELAWLGQFMIIRDQLLITSAPRMILLVPFSGEFFRIVSDNPSPNLYIRDPENSPSVDQLRYYINFLRGFGLDPTSIAERFQRAGQTTVLVMMVDQDLISLMSFLEIMIDWAKLEGIRPDRLREALEVLVITVDFNAFEFPMAITDEEFTIDLIHMDLGSIRSMYTIERIAYPEIIGDYVRLVPDYPPRIWNQPPPEFDERHERRGRVMINRFTEIVARNIRLGTLAPFRESDFNFVCRPHRRSYKRDLSSHYVGGIKTINLRHKNSFNKTSPDEVFGNRQKNRPSVVSKKLEQACNEYFKFIGKNKTGLSKQVYTNYHRYLGRIMLAMLLQPRTKKFADY